MPVNIKDVDIDAVIAAMETDLDRQREAAMGNRKLLLDIHCTRAVQVPAVRFLFTEQKAGTDLREIGINFGIVFGKIIAQVLTQVSEGDRNDAIEVMVDAIKLTVEQAMEVIDEARRGRADSDGGTLISTAPFDRNHATVSVNVPPLKRN